MSRYNDIDTITFTNKDGNSFPVKDIRPIPVEPVGVVVSVVGDTFIDEVSSRPEIYGDLGEDQSYRIFDANVIKLVENDFNVVGLNELKVPI